MNQSTHSSAALKLHVRIASFATIFTYVLVIQSLEDIDLVVDDVLLVLDALLEYDLDSDMEITLRCPYRFLDLAKSAFAEGSPESELLLFLVRFGLRGECRMAWKGSQCGE